MGKKSDAAGGVFRTTISMRIEAKRVCDVYIARHGLKENINDFSDLVARALMAYCLPRVNRDIYVEDAETPMPEKFAVAEEAVSKMVETHNAAAKIPPSRP